MSWFDPRALWSGKTETKDGIKLSEVTGAMVQQWGWDHDPGAPSTAPRSLASEGYRKNSAVFICMNKLASAFSGPQLKVHKKKSGEWLDEHPYQLLLDQPNPIMGGREFRKYHITYKAFGGNGYIYKLRSQGFQVGELWPYHDIEMHPIPGGPNWIDCYAYGLDLATAVRVDRKDIIHEKWAVDPLAPHRGMGALHTIAREFATDSEITRYVQALIVNDAVPRTVLKRPTGGQPLSQVQKDQLKADFAQRFGGSKRGSIAILENMEIERVAMNIQELAVDALRGSNESRIASAIGVPVEIAGLVSSSGHRTYSNYGEARTAFVEDTLMPHWQGFCDELNADLTPEFGDDIEVRFDLSTVPGLQTVMLQKRKDARESWKVKGLTLNEFRRELGQDPVAGGDDIWYSGAAKQAGDAVDTQTDGDPAANDSEPTDNARLTDKTQE